MEDSFDMRRQFVINVLVGRLGWKIEGWDIMDYCMKLTIVGNRMLRQLEAMATQDRDSTTL